jgi:cytochrome c553
VRAQQVQLHLSFADSDRAGRNSILLVDFIDTEIRGGRSVEDAAVRAGAIRAKSIVLTALAAMVGVFFILDDPIFNGLAVSLIFGILVSTDAAAPQYCVLRLVVGRRTIVLDLLVRFSAGIHMQSIVRNRHRAWIALSALFCASSGGNAAPAADVAAARKEFLEAARLTPDSEHGKQLYETCAECHGSTGRGTADGTVPAIAGQHGSVLLKQLVDFRHDQRWDERMEHFTDRHHLPAAQDLTDVAAYISSQPRFPNTSDAIGDGVFLHDGASVYFRECEACHGPLGQGDGLRLRPRLAGQHYEYLLRQLGVTAAGFRPGMDPAHVLRLRRLSPEQIRGVADYLSRVSPDLSSRRVSPSS